MPEINSVNFADLEKLRRFLNEILARHVVSLNYYYGKEFAGFYHKHERDKSKISMSSTSTCVLSLIRTGNWRSGPWYEKTADTIKAFLEQPWKSAELKEDNPFTVAFVLEAVTALTTFVDFSNELPTLQQRVDRADEILKSAVPEGGVSLQGYPASAYLTQLVARVLRQRGCLDADSSRRFVDWAWREIDHQVALQGARSKTVDFFQLAYCILLVSDFGDPGEMTPDQSLILMNSLETFFANQLTDGTWPRSRPLFHYPGVGSAYCYEFELLVQLLRCQTLQNRLLKYLNNFGKAAFNAEETSYALPDGGLGWTSGHHPQLRGPESWSTASVFHFAHNLERLVAEGIRKVIFEELDLAYKSPGKPKGNRELFASNFLDCPLQYNGETRSLKETLLAKFVEPVESESQNVEDGRSMAKTTPMSAIFFGPPGTSKTELAKSIADYLDWPLLTVDPSYFVKNGMDHIQAQADKLFSMLAASERIVVLLDEFDEMVRERARSDDVLSRFLTTAMLPKLATINKSRRLVFIVATNYIENFDVAIARPGRFDLIIQVMPPQLDAKLLRWEAVKNKLSELQLEGNGQVRSILESLTFDKFSTFARQAETAPNKDAFIRIAEDFASRSTLQTHTASDRGNELTWEAASKDQQRKIRLPL